MSGVIPNRIFQSHKSVQYIESNKKLLTSVNTWKIYSPEFAGNIFSIAAPVHADFEYFFYSDSMCDEFMRVDMLGEFDGLYEAYKKLPLPVMKSDLWRYCVVYKYGGVYADTDTICRINPNVFTSKKALLVFAPEIGTPYFCQWCFAAPAKSPVLREIIYESIRRILSMGIIKGEHITHYVTGPALFTDGVKLYLQNNNLPVFDSNEKFTNYPNDALFVYNREIFHHQLVNHFFHGSNDVDGWKKQARETLN